MIKNEQSQHITLYRRYRPTNFGEVLGQSHIVDTLQKSIASGRVAHAYLFSGGRGTGKTTVARILARELGVSDKDLYEMDAASNRGIDDIRALREGVYAMPFESKYKLYIIDEAHMLTKEAWNALLKTLEEPPAHCIFVLATTELDKVPETIQSRCEAYAFKQPTREMLANATTAIAESEGYTLDRAEADLIALLAEGSFRDALSILQKILSTADGKKIDSAMIETIAGAPRGEIVREIIRGIVKYDANTALKALRDAKRSNLDARVLAKILIERLRTILLMRYASDMTGDLAAGLTEQDATLARELIKDSHITSDTLRTILEAHSIMAYAAVPFLPLELAVIDICEKHSV
jgi:DNA polymerase-3 subunit gamma/tau